MNRHDRRVAAAKDRSKDPKAKITFHTDPLDVSKEHIAILMTAMNYAFTAGIKIPGVQFPMHIVVEFAGMKVCGTVEPATGPEEPARLDPTVH